MEDQTREDLCHSDGDGDTAAENEGGENRYTRPGKKEESRTNPSHRNDGRTTEKDRNYISLLFHLELTKAIRIAPKQDVEKAIEEIKKYVIFYSRGE